MSVLDEIVKNKILELEEVKRLLPLEEIKKSLNNTKRRSKFFESIFSSINKGKPGLIAEIKFASPSKGDIRLDLQPEDVAKVYENSYLVDCISVLTEKKYFKGDISFINRVKSITNKPILRKDFIIDEYQLFESAYYGADCVLLIATILTREELKEFYTLARQLGLDVLVEIYGEEDLQKIERLNLDMLGVNSRNLKTLDVSLSNLKSMISYIKGFSKVLVAESGIKTREDVENLIKYGFNSFLVGESFMISDNIYKKITELFSGIVLYI
ncbi:MAG: indole-3-glycerol phosphate synthase TrpC [Brevinematia bacterium]